MTNSVDPSPFNPLPAAVWLLFLALVVPEALFSLGEAGVVGGPAAVGWRLAALNDYAFSGDAFDYMVENGRILPEHMMRFATYPFVHVGFTSFLFAGVILLAIGKMVGEVMGGWAVVLVFAVSSVSGALIFGLLTDQPWLFGAFPGVYGLIGAYTFLLWQRQVVTGGPQVQAFRLIGVLMALQLFFGVFFGTGYAWVGELGGFCVGFFLTGFVMPGGMSHALAVLRRR